ncbi:hypothetical protein G6F70_008612 [Rhizopus microsporus]|uniref:Uncharacterized protein n=1 Tax=Rhizopus azygosporus TaxID=86630 RepID=A0A367JF80_RHIAZ|nr:hypothetical protein G6F71_008441 [Rhizopus microsporus]RCH88519.1 hypothetical protein CU097_005736 [Rhizopus azygosporus]KAG1194950.1 hypothetical protein G6F70_008612 [Rhizopus microsporus]KAG1206803.1 hypothetical protein G6F69_008556 [Rhizopus microsporus]KAG1227329.1 hypothetical protein G6F67_008519 [Rhizopus microsporus]
MPASLKHLEKSQIEERINNTFDQEFIANLHQARFQQRLLGGTLPINNIMEGNMDEEDFEGRNEFTQDLLEEIVEIFSTEGETVEPSSPFQQVITTIPPTISTTATQQISNISNTTTTFSTSADTQQINSTTDDTVTTTNGNNTKTTKTDKSTAATTTSTTRKLCYSKRRNSTKRKANKFLPKLGKIISYPWPLQIVKRVLSVTVCEASRSLADNNSEDGNPGSNGNRSSCGKIHADGNHRGVQISTNRNNSCRSFSRCRRQQRGDQWFFPPTIILTN